MTAVAVVARSGPGAPAAGEPVPVVLVAGDDEIGRGWLRVDRGPGARVPVATTWAPRLRPGLDRATRGAAFDAHAGWALAAATADGAGALETKPADDVDGLDEWLATLRRHGFGEVAVAHLLTRPLPAVAPAGTPIAGLAVAAIDGLGPDDRRSLEALVTTVHRTTGDRVDTVDGLAGGDVLAQLAGDRLAAPAPDLWLAALDGRRPVGYVLGSVAGDDVWVMDVGVDPGARRRGIGRWLLATVLARASGRFAHRACALVDDDNVASRRLHAAAGFVEEPGAYRTWRRTLEPGRRHRKDGPPSPSTGGVPPCAAPAG